MVHELLEDPSFLRPHKATSPQPFLGHQRGAVLPYSPWVGAAAAAHSTGTVQVGVPWLLLIQMLSSNDHCTHCRVHSSSHGCVVRQVSFAR